MDAIGDCERWGDVLEYRVGDQVEVQVLPGRQQLPRDCTMKVDEDALVQGQYFTSS